MTDRKEKHRSLYTTRMKCMLFSQSLFLVQLVNDGTVLFQHKKSSQFQCWSCTHVTKISNIKGFQVPKFSMLIAVHVISDDTGLPSSPPGKEKSVFRMVNF